MLPKGSHYPVEAEALEQLKKVVLNLFNKILKIKCIQNEAVH